MSRYRGFQKAYQILDRPQKCRGARTIYKRHLTSRTPLLQVSEEVRDAVDKGHPVVALETTIYTHGFPYPENIALSSRLESAVRVNGGVPATIGILNGRPIVGMQPEEIIELLERSQRSGTMKISRRDISFVSGLGINGNAINGGTTISGTMVLAHLASIRVFATGGLGGVHKGGENSLDISADLTELGRTPVTVISSGCKSFLDIPRTLEFLETQGVGVATFADGRSGDVDFPAFWTRDSGVRSPKTLADEKAAAAMIHAHSRLGLTSGLHFANPIASEHSLAKAKMDSIIAEATVEAERTGKSGSDNTPFILDHIRRSTGDASIHANRHLVEANVIRGTKVAVELAVLEQNERISGSRLSQSHAASVEFDADQRIQEGKVGIMVAGSLAIDLACNYNSLIGNDTDIAMKTSNPSIITQKLGGVGQNIATAAHYSGVKVQLCSVVGDDASGKAAIELLQQRGLSTESIHVASKGDGTARYVAVNDSRNDLVLAMADMRILEGGHEGFKSTWRSKVATSKPAWLIVDANWDKEMVRRWVDAGLSVGSKIAFEPVSVEKSTRIFYKTWQDHMNSLVKSTTDEKKTGRSWTMTQLADLSTPNELELMAMSKQTSTVDAWTSLLFGFDEDLLLERIYSLGSGSLHGIGDAVLLAALKLLSNIPCLLTKLGPKGVLLTEVLQAEDTRLEREEEAGYILFRKTPSKFNHDLSILLPETEPDSSLSKIGGVYMRLFPAVEEISEKDIVSVNGAGDTFLGVLVALMARSKDKRPVSDFVDVAQSAAVLTLKSTESVSPRVRDMGNYIE